MSLSDDANPKYIFSTIATSLMVSIVKGEIDPHRLAAEELAKRGLNMDGKWIGFKAAEQEAALYNITRGDR